LSYDADYIIIDTSPGIRYWSINALGVADTLFLTLKMGSLDINGTKKMARDIYGSFSKFGSKSYVVLNRMAGYCSPPQMTVNVSPTSSLGSLDATNDKTTAIQRQESSYDISNNFSKEVGMNINKYCNSHDGRCNYYGISAKQQYFNCTISNCFVIVNQQKIRSKDKRYN
jgi:MinD superfamily P-loop ATPase